jgi:hypothetical protein
MGFVGSLGNVFKSVGSIVKPLAQAAIKGIAPAATNMLKNIVGSGFDGVLKAAQGYVSRLPFIGDLASKLLGKGAESLKGMAFGGIDKLVGQLVNKLTPQTISGQTVTTPTLANRGGAAVSHTSSAATAALTQATQASGGAFPAAIRDSLTAATAPGLSKQQQGMIDQLKASGADDKQIAQMQVQMQMDNMKQMMEMFSNIAKTMAGISSTIVGNIRG